MNKYILASIIRHNESKTFGFIKPFYLALHLLDHHLSLSKIKATKAET
jgi:hypothetical protein